MPTTILERGVGYPLPEACAYCGNHQANYLARVAPTPEEKISHVYRFLFQCRWCHATRVMHLHSSDDGTEVGKPA